MKCIPGHASLREKGTSIGHHLYPLATVFQLILLPSSHRTSQSPYRKSTVTMVSAKLLAISLFAAFATAQEQGISEASASVEPSTGALPEATSAAASAASAAYSSALASAASSTSARQATAPATSSSKAAAPTNGMFSWELDGGEGTKLI
jgi:hypothetical protein